MSRRLLRAIASLRLTVSLLAATALVLGWSLASQRSVAIPLAVLFTAMTANLLAAIAVHAGLRTRLPLLVFHLALAALAALAAGGRLTALSGHVEIAEGTPFDPAHLVAEAGPLHPWALDEVHFYQGWFAVDYLPGVRRRGTRSQVLLQTPDGGLERVTIGDDRPLVIRGYRFYTSFNKGFAPLLEFVGADGVPQRGLVHLPSYPLNDDVQGNVWRLPDGRELTFWLSFEQPPLLVDAAWKLDSRSPLPAVLTVRDGRARVRLRPGGSAVLHGGRLTFLGLRGWMGYTVSYDPTRQWMLAVALVGMTALVWHTLGRAVGRRPARLASAEADRG